MNCPRPRPAPCRRSVKSSCCGGTATDGTTWPTRGVPTWAPTWGTAAGCRTTVSSAPSTNGHTTRAGRNVDIPYADRPNRKARLRTYETTERNGHLLAWYHPDPAVAPSWEVPDALPEQSVECQRFNRQVHTGWQELAENSVDMSHFRSVHGMSQVGEVGELYIDGPYRRVRSSQSFQTPRGEFEGQIESNSYGPGMGVIHFTLMGTVTLISATTPIERDLVDVRFTMYHRAGDEMAAKIGIAFGAEVERQFDQDIPIWEHKRYQASPALAPSEKPITAFRKWASQFYAGRTA